MNSQTDLSQSIQQRCIICGNEHMHVLFTGCRDRLFNLPGDFTLLSCDQCQCVSVSPQLGEEIGEYYPETYISYPLAIEDEKSRIRQLDRAYGLHRRCREITKRSPQPGSILDIGCATGIFLNGMSNLGWKSYGVEPNQHASRYARERFGLEIFHGYLEETSYPTDSFDLVTMWDVLEHMKSPHEALNEIHRILKPGGLLCLSLPNSNAYERHIFGKYWAGWDTPRHYHIYNTENIKTLLAQHGFETQEITSFTGRHGVFILNMEFWSTDWRVSPALKKFILGMSRSIIARGITYLPYQVLERINRSSIMSVFARLQK